MRTTLFYITLSLAIMVNIAARLISTQSKDLYHIFFKGEALTFLLLAIGMRIAAQQDHKAVIEAFILLTFSNLMDEIVFDPETFGWNEVVIAILAVLWLKIRPILWKRLNKN